MNEKMNEWNEWRMNKFNKINNYFFIFLAGFWKKNCLAEWLCISHIPRYVLNRF